MKPNSSAVVTSHGLQTSTGRPQWQRHVRDKVFYYGALQVKANEIANELNRMRKEIADLARDYSAMASLDVKVRDLARELTENQGKLADMNQALCRYNTGDENAISTETLALKQDNDEMESEQEYLLANRQRYQQEIAKIQRSLQMEQMECRMSPVLADRYHTLTHQRSVLNQVIAKFQAEMSALSAFTKSSENAIYSSPQKTKLVHLELELFRLQKKREIALSTICCKTEQSIELSQEIRESLNAEKWFKSETNELVNKLEKKTNENAKNGEKDNFFQALQRKGSHIEKYLLNCDKVREIEETKLKEKSKEILKILYNLKSLAVILPNGEDLRTVMSPVPQDSKGEPNQLKHALIYSQKLKFIDVQIDSSLSSMDEKMALIKTQLENLNVSDLEAETESKKIALSSAQSTHRVTRPNTKLMLRLALNDHEAEVRRLVDSQEHSRIVQMEETLSKLQSEQFSMREYMEEIISEEEVDGIQHRVLRLVENLNEMYKSVNETE